MPPQTRHHLAALALLALTAHAQAAPVLSLPDRQAALRYSHALDAAKANPAAANWPALRAAYAASPAYDPNMGHTLAENPMAPALQRNDFRTAATLADQATAQNWMDLRAHLMGYLAYTRLKDPAHAAPHQAAAQGINKAILATGNGVTPATAMHVLATSEEYVQLLFLHLKMQKQSLVRQNGHIYDKLDVARIPTGEPATIWFNIDTSFPREAAIATGHAVPVPDPDLPR